ncbi:unnamed protein product [Rhizophagus irregularis]|nr:unnamed protein product [Rhizophagus irregularis]
MKQIFSARKGISYTKQLAFKGRKSYERPSANEVITNSKLSHHIWKPIAAILIEQYIKSSDFALLYSEVNSYCAYNELTEDIFLNHTFDEDDFAMIQVFKEDTLPKKEVANYRYKCSKDDIKYNMNLIDQWYNESLQALEKLSKEVKH